MPGYLILGVFVLAIANLTWIYAVEHGDKYIISNIVFLTPIVSLVFVTVLIKEPILFSAIIGTIMVITGLILQSVCATKKSNLPELSEQGD